MVIGLDKIEITVDLDKSSSGGLLGAIRLEYTGAGRSRLGMTGRLSEAGYESKTRSEAVACESYGAQKKVN